ncbi:efflux RND transporter periplasmic adaptor subunit [Aliiroseovarius sp.]|uniref:efflux RND transporter periplasmic adaptor subunit n=1 Tax=Aliiroseovarius sp. TaxID=1872442 RepID=UPI003BAC72B4
MRIVPILTALVVVTVLFFLVFQREQLLNFAAGGDATSPPAEMAEPGETAASDATEASPTVETGTGVSVIAFRSTAREIDSAVLLRGRTEAARQVELMAETSGLVISEPLRKGMFVEAGQIMCRLDPGTREATLAEARARLAEAEAAAPQSGARVAEAQARLDEALINLNAADKLSEGGFASETRVASAKAAVEAARAGLVAAESGEASSAAAIQSAQAGVAAATREIERLEITAPFAGHLESDTAELGSLMQPGALCATIVQLDPLKLVGFVSELDVDNVNLGVLAGGRLANGQEVAGRVTFLSRAADPVTRTFRVEVEVANPDLTLRDGQTAEIVIAAEGRHAHLIPQSALTLNDEGALGVRIVGDGDITAFAAIELLRDTVDGVWVGGLPDEVGVIVRGQDYVSEGVPLSVTWQEPDA